MTVNLALEYIPRRMGELGFGNNYVLRFRHLVLQANETLSLDAQNQFFILVEEADGISVESPGGMFDLSSTVTNEMQYEHQGKITVRNQTVRIIHARFIQVIPKHDKSN